MEYIYRKLATSFSEIKGFDGWMIAKAEFNTVELNFSKNTNIETIETKNTKILKQRRNYCTIMSEIIYNNMKYSLVAHLVKPKSRSTRNPVNVSDNCSYLFTLKYTKEDIRQFVCDLGDYNYIHQTDTPVVSGFLVFRDILKKLFLGTGKCTIVFRNPAFADETIDVFQIGDCEFKLILSERGIVYGESVYSRRN